jgi:hypothetical protein
VAFQIYWSGRILTHYFYFHMGHPATRLLHLFLSSQSPSSSSVSLYPSFCKRSFLICCCHLDSSLYLGYFPFSSMSSFLLSSIFIYSYNMIIPSWSLVY